MKKVAGVVKMIIATSFFWSISHLGVSWVNQQWRLQIPAYWEGLLTLFIMFSLFTATMWTISKLSRHSRMDFLTVMIEAMKQISKGDYNIQLANQFEHHENHPFARIVEGMNEMAVELNQIEEMRQEFISNVSHEIQSPLASINGFANVLKQNNLTVEEREHYLGIIETESLRLANLSDNLLKLTSIESQHHPFEPVSYRLDKQIRAIILSCEPQWLA